MSEELIPYLKKNIIIKILFYFLCLTLQIGFLNSFYQKNSRIIQLTNQREILLTKEILKLFSIKNSKQRILTSYTKYQTLLSMPYKQKCIQRVNLMNKIINLSQKYQLNQPITVITKQNFLSKFNSLVEEEESTIKIRNYDLKIKFASQNFLICHRIIRDIYANMPENTIILSIEVEKEDILRPDIINKLSIKKLPDIIFAKLTMRIRELEL